MQPHPLGNFLVKIWEISGKFERNLSKFWAKVINICANLIRHEQNQNFAYLKH